MLLLDLKERTGEDLSDFVDIQRAAAVPPPADLDVSGPFQRLAHAFGRERLAGC